MNIRTRGENHKNEDTDLKIQTQNNKRNKENYRLFPRDVIFANER